MHKIAKTNLILLGLALLLRGGAYGSALDQLGAAAGAPGAAAVPAAPAPELREWTVMAYLVGNDKRLQQNALYDMNFLEMAGAPAGTAVVAELGLLDWSGAGDKQWQGSKRYLVKKDASADPAAAPVSDVLQVLPAADMGDYRHLAEFIAWAKANYPARHYALYLHGHGNGWRDPSKNKAVAFDDASGNFIGTAEFGEAFRMAGGVDVLFSISCLTQMTEVMYELRGAVGYAVASEESNLAFFKRPDGTKVPTSYQASLLSLALAENPAASPRDLAAAASEGAMYFRNLSKTGDRLTFSAVNVSALDALSARLDEWAALAEALDDREAARAAVRGVLRFDAYGGTLPVSDSGYADLGDFVGLYAGAVRAASPEAEAFRARSRELLAFLSSEAVIRNDAVGLQKTGMDYARARGLAITVPPWRPGMIDAAFRRYGELAFARDGAWDRFILKYLWNNATDAGFTPDF